MLWLLILNGVAGYGFASGSVQVIKCEHRVLLDLGFYFSLPIDQLGFDYACKKLQIL